MFALAKSVNLTDEEITDRADASQLYPPILDCDAIDLYGLRYQSRKWPFPSSYLFVHRPRRTLAHVVHECLLQWTRADVTGSLDYCLAGGI